MAELPRVADVEKESQYGYVFGVSGPGEQTRLKETRLQWSGGACGS